MKYLFLAATVLLPLFAQAQTGQNNRDLASYNELGAALYLQANTPESLARMRKDLVKAPEAYLISIPQPGTLVVLPQVRLKVPAMRYNVALRLLEATDSTGSHVWPAGSLYGFEMGKPGEVRHFRSHLVKTGNTRMEFVEVLTVDVDKAPPLILALQHNYLHEDVVLDPVLRTVKTPARTVIGQVVLAGPGLDPKIPLRELALSEKNVTKLFGAQAPQVRAYAANQHLSYIDLNDVLKMVEYYNQKVAGK